MFNFRQITLVVLSLSLIVKSFVVPFICLDYELRKEFIIKNYCVNKNRPELHCDGKCFLAKKIKAQTDKEEQAALQNFIYKLLEINSFESQSTFDFANVVEIKDFSVRNYLFAELSTLDFTSSFFHPPSIV